MNKIKSKKRLTYISLFSGGGIGCYGFKLKYPNTTIYYI